VGLAPLAWGQNSIVDPRSLAPYVPTPPKVVERMLQLAGVDKTDTVYDLGSGDGRIVITAAQEFGAKAVGVELDRTLVDSTEDRIRQLKLEDRASILHANMFDVDLSQASVVTLYLMTSANEIVKPKLESSLKPGTRVVSHDFQIAGWVPIRSETLKGQGRDHKIYVYEIGKQLQQ
jgi:16S rRNA A1518/A1519 N6-dimethyltransferase RsmA/KsgA/DIM1 with predicted DNA glycosylase/AP lyase activity